MLYWIIWLTIGIVCVLFLCLLALQAVFRLRRAVLSGTMGERVRWLLLSVFCVALAVFEASWVSSCYVLQKQMGFGIGNAAFDMWSVYAAVGVAAVGAGVGGLIIRFCFAENKPVAKRQVAPRKSGGMLFAVQVIVLAVAALGATAILTLIADYVLLRKFTIAFAKRLVSAGVFFELAIAAVIAAVRWRRVWKYRRAVTVVFSAILSVLTAAIYVLLVLGDRDVVEKVLFFGVTGVFVLLPILFVIGLIFWCRLYRKKQLSDVLSVDE